MALCLVHMEPPHRQSFVPSADNPRMVARLVDLVAQGVRSTRGLQEALGADARTVQSYAHAAAWLGFLATEAEPQLTGSGLEFAYAGRQRARVYALAVWSHPFVVELMHGRTELPNAADVADLIVRKEPDLPTHVVPARAAAVLALITPAIGRSRLKTLEDHQLELPLVAKTTAPEPLRLGLKAGRDYNPDVYRFVLCALLDHGELSLGQVRALLDRAQVTEAPLGGYVDLALSRGDAVRLEERLVATRSAIAQRDLADTTASIALSDPSYRGYLSELKLAASGDRQAQIRIDRVRSRFRIWDHRLFGHEIDPERVEPELRRVLMDRSLESFPMAKGPGVLLPAVKEPFLDAWDQPGLAIALPPTLAALRNGLDPLNAALKHARQGAQDVSLPDVAHRPVLYHGGIIHPGEPLPKVISDIRSLRLRLLMHAPYPALVAALLLLHRSAPQRFELLVRRSSFDLRVDENHLGEMLDILDGFAYHRGWTPCRRRQGTLRSSALLQVLESLGIASRVGPRAVLAERFFVQLRTEPDEIEVHRRLQALAEALHAWLETQTPPDAPPVIE